jgi:cytochrome c biogenesis protein CcdA
VEKYRTSGSEPPWERAEVHLDRAEERILSRFRSLEILTIVSAGLLDGVNPCAFATLVFFISYLAFVIKRRTDILLVGLAFVAAVFISYFLIGVGLLNFIQRLGFMRVAGRIVYLVTAGIAVVFGILSIHDYFKYSGGDYDGSFLRLPGFLRKRTQDVVRKKMDTEKYVLGAFVTGFLISLLEFACTGQVYLPTIIFVTKIPELRTLGLLYLLLYNVCFIIPLLVVFLFAYRGMTAERLFFLLRSHGKTVKLLTAIMFFGLAGVLIFYLL